MLRNDSNFEIGLAPLASRDLCTAEPPDSAFGSINANLPSSQINTDDQSPSNHMHHLMRSEENLEQINMNRRNRLPRSKNLKELSKECHLLNVG